MIIKEFLPNPVGKDADGEYIKLFNDGSQPVLLNGWTVKDAGGKIFKLQETLKSGEELALPYSQTGISLNNNGETIFLYDASGKLADELSYLGQAQEGQIITKRLTTGESAISGNKERILNRNDLNFSRLVFMDFSVAVILALLGLYIILQLEKKLNIKLW